MSKTYTQGSFCLIKNSVEELFHYKSKKKLIDYDYFYDLVDWNQLRLVDFEQLQLVDFNYLGSLVHMPTLKSWFKYSAVYMLAFAFTLISLFSYVSLFNKLSLFNDYLSQKSQIAIMEDMKNRDLAVYSPTLSGNAEENSNEDLSFYNRENPVQVLNEDYVVEVTPDPWYETENDRVELAYLELEQADVLGAVTELQDEGMPSQNAELVITIDEPKDYENMVDSAVVVPMTNENPFSPAEVLAAETAVPSSCSFKVEDSHFGDGAYYYKKDKGNVYVCVNYDTNSYYSVWESKDKKGNSTTLQALNLLPDCMSVDDLGTSVTVSVYNNELEFASSCTLNLSDGKQVANVSNF